MVSGAQPKKSGGRKKGGDSGRCGDAPADATCVAGCIICANDSVGFLAVGPCDHPVCSMCALRLRVKNHDKKCAMCKQEMLTMVVFPARSPAPAFVSFDVTSSALEAPLALPGMEWDQASGLMFVDCRRHARDMEALRSNVCPAKGCTERFPSEPLLLRHLSGAHGQHICALCLAHQSLFLSEHRLMTEAQLKQHLKAPAFGKDKAGGHPLCQFCDERLFDAQALYRHMRQYHENCPLCPAVHQHRFYATVEDLDDHLRAEHLVCPQCDAAADPSHRGGSRLVTFTSHAEYTAHMLDLHGVRAVAFMTNFRVGSSGGGGPGGGCGNGERGEHGGRKINVRGGARFLDLDVTSDNPTRYARVGVGRGRLGGAFDAASGSALPSFSGAAGQEDDGLAHGMLIPANYRIAGSVSGAGTFTRNASAAAMEAASTAAHEVAAEKARRAPKKVNLGDFPALASELSLGRDSVYACGGAAPPKVDHSPHPMSIMHSTQREAARARLAEQEEALRARDADSRLQARNQLLAESFGVSLHRADPMHATSAQPAAASLAPPLMAFLRRPLYTSFILQWTRKNRGSTQLPRIEKALHQFFATPGQSSLQLKPMEAGPRVIVHMLARYYGLASCEFDAEPRRYVSLVRGPDSAPPTVLLSAAALLPLFDFTPTLLRTLESPMLYFNLINGYFQRLAGSVNSERGFAVLAPTIAMVVNRVRSTLQRRGLWRLCPVASVKNAGASGLGLEFASLEAANAAYGCLKHAEAPLVEAGGGALSLLDLFEMEPAFEPQELPEYAQAGPDEAHSRLEDVDWSRNFSLVAAELQGVQAVGGEGAGGLGLADRTVLSARGFAQPGRRPSSQTAEVPDSWDTDESAEDGGQGEGEAHESWDKDDAAATADAARGEGLPRAPSQDAAKAREECDWREGRGALLTEDPQDDLRSRIFANSAGTGERIKLELQPRSLPPPLPPLQKKTPLLRPPARKPTATKRQAAAPCAANSFSFLGNDSDDDSDDSEDEKEEVEEVEEEESKDCGGPASVPDQPGALDPEEWIGPADPNSVRWSCEACTYLNVSAFLRCEICGLLRPHAEVLHDPLDDEGWTEAS